MPPRRQNASAKGKAEKLKVHRAVKRGEVVAPEKKIILSRSSRLRAMRIDPEAPLFGSAANAEAIQAAMKLQSAFVPLPPRFLEETRELAYMLFLPRPLSFSSAVLPDFAHVEGDTTRTDLTCPKRPLWRFDMAKSEVEQNEQEAFQEWINRTDGLVEQWREEGKESDSTDETTTEPSSSTPPAMPRAPPYFERNLEVWRQLWRVTEISQIILVLLDSRCPLLHYPPSLANFLVDRKVILVLTKVDIAGPIRAEAWERHLKDNHPGSRVVQVQSYAEKASSGSRQGRAVFEPHLPTGFRERLVETIREVHAELLSTSAGVEQPGQRSAMKKDINWDDVLKAHGANAGSATALQTNEEGPSEPEFLTIGIIGQPNVGKSALLNALFGTQKVKASKTPGKTKHFQTLFWTPDVRLVDCPGLVMPNYVPMELQVLSGILPISRVSAVPSCTWHASTYLPIEKIYALEHPKVTDPPAEPVVDKRTWRGLRPVLPTPSVPDPKRALEWTAMDVLTAYAKKKRWVAAQSGRPDVHRAGNAILRALAGEEKVGWAFWPPGTTESEKVGDESGGDGAWISKIKVRDMDSESESDEIPSDDEEEESEMESDLDEGEEAKVDPSLPSSVGLVSRFGLLDADDSLIQ